MLKCPICKSDLIKKAQTYQCQNGHSFDISKQGYTTLLLKGANHSGDDAELVKGRIDFLEKGYYEKLRDKVNEIIARNSGSIIVDAGCGEGYYTRSFADNAGEVYGFDMSKKTLKYASAHDPKSHYFLSSIYNLPIGDHTCDIATNIFAPAAIDEFKRIVKKGGILIKVDPGAKHLFELKTLLYDNPYLNEEKPLNDLELIDKEELTYQIELKQEDLINLFKMTPYYYKSAVYGMEKLKHCNKIILTISFIIYTYRL